MAIPVATTLISVERAPDRSNVDPDEYADTDFATIDTDVRAVISTGQGRAGYEGGPSGSTELITFRLAADPCDLRHLDQVTDQITGQRFEVAWALKVPGVAGHLAHVAAGLTSREG